MLLSCVRHALVVVAGCCCLWIFIIECIDVCSVDSITCYTCGFIGPSLSVLVFAVSEAIQGPDFPKILGKILSLAQFSQVYVKFIESYKVTIFIEF